MKRIFFLPYWYQESKIEKRRRIIGFCSVVIFLLDLIFLDILLLKMNKIKILEDNAKQNAILQKSEYLKKNEKLINSDKTLESFFGVINSTIANTNFHRINIENRSVDLQINNLDFDYSLFIKAIEKENKFIIRSLELPYEEENGKFKINLELK